MGNFVKKSRNHTISDKLPRCCFFYRVMLKNRLGQKSILKMGFLSVLLLIPFLSSQAQSSISMQVIVHPPYSAYLDQLTQQAILNITNNEDTPLTIYLRAQIANGDQFIRTKMNIFSDPIQIGAHGTVTLNNVNFNYASFLGANVIEDNLTNAEINAIYRDKILPEGDYVYCVWAYTRDANGNYHPISLNGLPQGQDACTSFVLILAQPPIITQPMDQSLLNSQTLSNITFSWIPSSHTTPGSSIRYDLYIVKVNDGDDPDADMQNAFTYHSNYYIKIPDITGNSYVFNTKISPYQFEQGQRYAVMVQAKDINGKSFFENEGKSQVTTFTTSSPENTGMNNALTFGIFSPKSNTDTLTVSPEEDMYANWSWLMNNKLFDPDTVAAFQDKHIGFYRFSIQPGHQGTGHKTDATFQFQTLDTAKAHFPGAYFQSSSDSLQKIGMKNDYWYYIKVEALDKNKQMVANAETKDFNLRIEQLFNGPTAHIAGQLRYRFDGYAQDYPIPNTPIRIYSASELSQNAENGFYTQTDSSGNFVADIPVPSTATADTSFKIGIESPYYQQIDTAVFHLSRVASTSGTANNTKVNIGQLITKAYSYSLTLHVKKGFSAYIRHVNSFYISGYHNGNPITVKTVETDTIGVPDTTIQELPAGLPVMLYRKQKPAYLPPVEGGYMGPPVNGIIPVAEGTTATMIGKDGKQSAYVKFNRLLCNVFNDDVYYIKALQPDTSNGSEPYQEGPFEAPEQEQIFHKPFSSDTTHFNVDATYQIISKDPPKSVISGQLLYRWPDDPSKTLRPLTHEKFSIVVEYLYNGKPIQHLDYKYGTDIYLKGHSYINQKPLPAWDAEQVMATGTTDSTGRFTIQAVNLNSKGAVGEGEVDTNRIPPPPVPTLTPTLQNLQQQIINPADPSQISTIGQNRGMLNGNNIFNYENLGGSFGLGYQQSTLNGTINSGLNGFAGRQGQALGAARLLKTLNPESFVTMNEQSGHGPWATYKLHVYHRSNPVGQIERVYRIDLQDKDLYYNPDKNIVVQPLQATDTGPITVMVKEVKWDLKAIDENGNSSTMAGLKAVVFRDPSTKIPGLPQGEGDGLYRINPLINPKLTGEVTIPKNEQQTPTNTGNQQYQVGNYGQWLANQQPIPETQIFNNAPTWPANSYEWLADSTTDSIGSVSFDRLLGGFTHYYAELTSSPQTGSVFYQANIQQLLDAGDGKVTYDKNISPADNGFYWDERKTDVPVAHLTIQMKPFPSRIGGRVIDKSTSLGLPALVSAELTSLVNGKKEDSTTVWSLTDSTGYFEFLKVFDLARAASDVDNIQVEMRAYSSGYKQEETDIGTVSRTGKQYIKNILMVPGGLLTGYVKNEQGKPVDAYIKRGDGNVVSTGTAPPHRVAQGTIGGLVRFVTSTSGSPGQFAIAAPSNQKVTLYIIPKDVGYFPDTLHINVKNGTNNLNTITVFRRKHRMQFIVRDAVTAFGISQAQLSLSKTLDTLTNTQGTAIFNFENVSVDNYTLKVEGPKGQGYIPQIINLKNEESRDLQTYIIKLKKGGIITGTVTLDGQPVKGAKVYLDYQQQTSQNSWWSQLDLSNATYPVPGQHTLPGGGLPEIATYSGAGGQYTLSGIPINSGTVNVIATLDTSFTVIGDKETVSMTSSAGSQDLKLKSFRQMLIKSIYGFPLSVVNLETTGNNNQVKVTGLVDLGKGTSDFGFLNGTQQQVRISDILFVAKKINGQVVGVPAVQNVKMEATSSLKLSYLNKYNVLLTANGQNASTPDLLQIGENKAGQGTVNGYVNIVDNSFNYPSSYLNFTRKDQFYLCRINSSQVDNKLDAILAPGNSSPAGNVRTQPQTPTSSTLYHLCNLDAKPIQFKFIQFDASADPKGSYIDKDGKIHLDVSMQAHIPHAQPEDFAVHAGDLVIDNDKVYPATDTTTISVLLGKKQLWKLEARKWSIDPQEGGIYSTDALIKTGVLDIPCKEFNLRADMFVMDKFQLDKLELGGGVKMLENINSKNAQLVYDVKTGSDMSAHWKLAVSGSGMGSNQKPAAVIRNLSYNGQGNTYLDKNVNIEYIQLLDNGEDILSIQQNNTPMHIYGNGLAQFTPQSISSGPDFFQITGGLAIPAPRLVPVMTTLQFTGKPSALNMEVEPVQMSFEGKGYVYFSSDQAVNPTINSNHIIIPGSVYEKDGFNPITCTFYADGNSKSNAHYHVDLQKNFVLNLTSTSQAGSSGAYNLKLINGGMEVPKGANDWNLLSFTGNLLTTSDATLNASGNNTKANRMTFTVTGDVSVNGDSLNVSNINFPFGKMNMVYEFPQKRLIGHLTINGQNSASPPKFGPFSVSGEVDMQIDPHGWYFLGACQVQTHIPGPFSSINMGFLLGNRDFSSTEWTPVKDAVAQYSYDKSSLCWLQNKSTTGGIHGIFVTAGKNIVDSKIGFSIPLVAFYLEAIAGGEASLYTDFDCWGFKLGAGLYGEVDAGLSVPDVSIYGDAKAKASLSSSVSTHGASIDGNIDASVSGGVHVDFPPASAGFSEGASLMVGLSTNNGFHVSFQKGSGDKHGCEVNGPCSN